MSSWRSASTGSASATNSRMTGPPSPLRRGCGDIPFLYAATIRSRKCVMSCDPKDQLVPTLLQLGYWTVSGKVQYQHLCPWDCPPSFSIAALLLRLFKYGHLVVLELGKRIPSTA